MAEPLWAHSMCSQHKQICISLLPSCGGTTVGSQHLPQYIQICISPLPRCGGTVVGLWHVLTAAQICISPLPSCGGTVVCSQHVLPAYKNLYFTLTKVWRKHCGLTAYTNLYFPEPLWAYVTCCTMHKSVFHPYQAVAEPLWAHGTC